MGDLLLTCTIYVCTYVRTSTYVRGTYVRTYVRGTWHGTYVPEDVTLRNVDRNVAGFLPAN